MGGRGVQVTTLGLPDYIVFKYKCILRMSHAFTKNFNSYKILMGTLHLLKIILNLTFLLRILSFVPLHPSLSNNFGILLTHNNELWLYGNFLNLCCYIELDYRWYGLFPILSAGILICVGDPIFSFAFLSDCISDCLYFYDIFTCMTFYIFTI